MKQTITNTLSKLLSRIGITMNIKDISPNNTQQLNIECNEIDLPQSWIDQHAIQQTNFTLIAHEVGYGFCLRMKGDRNAYPLTYDLLYTLVKQFKTFSIDASNLSRIGTGYLDKALEYTHNYVETENKHD